LSSQRALLVSTPRLAPPSRFHPRGIKPLVQPCVGRAPVPKGPSKNSSWRRTRTMADPRRRPLGFGAEIRDGRFRERIRQRERNRVARWPGTWLDSPQSSTLHGDETLVDPTLRDEAGRTMMKGKKIRDDHVRRASWPRIADPGESERVKVVARIVKATGLFYFPSAPPIPYVRWGSPSVPPFTHPSGASMATR